MTVLEQVAANIAVERALPINAFGTGGTTFAVEVLYGDESAEKLQSSGETGRVVLTMGDGEIGPVKAMRGDHRTLCTWTPTFEAHVWAPIGPVGERSSLLRWDALEALIKVVVRAIYHAHFGANVPQRNAADAVRVNRDSKKLRNGQGAIIEFGVAIPICEGLPAQTMPSGARGTVTLVTNPE